MHNMNPLLLKAFLLISKLQIFRNNNPYLLNTLRILELIFLCYLMILPLFPPLRYPLFVSHSILSLLLVPLILLYLYLTPSRMQLNEWKHLTDVIFHILNGISLVLELLFLPFLLALSSILQSSLQYLPLAVCSIILLILVLLFHPASHLFGRTLVPILALYYLTASPLSFLFAIVFIPHQTLLVRLVYTVLAVVAIEATLLQHQPMSISRYVLSCAALVICVGIAVLYGEETDLSTVLKENEFMFEAIKGHMGKSVEESLDRPTQFTIEKILWRSPFKQDEIKKMTVLGVWELLVAKIANDLATSTSFELSLLEMQIKHLHKRDRFMGILKDCILLCQSFLHKASLPQKYALYQQVVQLEAAYLLRENDSSYPVLVVEAQMQTRLFYSRLQLCIDSLLKYWKGVQHGNENECNARILKLLTLQGQLDETIEKLSQFKHSPKERKLLGLLGELLESCAVTDTTEEHSSGVQKAITTIDYLIVENDIIVKVSSQLLVALDIKEPNIIREKKEVFFPKLISEYINAHIDQYVSSGQSLLLPIMTYSRHIVLKKCRLYIFPELFNGIKYMYSFQGCSSNNIILYDRNADQIINTSQLFFNTVDDSGNDCAPMLASRRTSKNITKILSISSIGRFNNQSTPINITNNSSHQIFNNLDLTSQETHSFLLANKRISTELHVKKVIRSTHNRIPNLKVILQLETSFQMPDHHLYLLSIEQGLSPSRENSRKTLKEQSRHLQYKRQTFFCPIPNAYETVLTETLHKIKHSPGRSNLFILKLLFHFSLLVALSVILISLSLASTRVETYSSCLSSGASINQQYSNITVNYFRAYLIEYLRLTNLPLALPLPTITAYYLSAVSLSTYQTLDSIYISQSRRKPFLQYMIRFQSFNVSTNTDEMSIVDFMELTQQSIYEGNLSTLLLNYNVFLSLKESYNIDWMYESSFELTIRIESVGYILALVCVGILTVFCYYYVLQIERVLSHLSIALSMISPQEISALLSRIQLLKESIHRKDAQQLTPAKDKQDAVIESDDSDKDSLSGLGFQDVLIDKPMTSSFLINQSNLSSENNSLNSSSYNINRSVSIDHSNHSTNFNSLNNSMIGMRDSSMRLLKQKAIHGIKEEQKPPLLKINAAINIPLVLLKNILYLLFFMFFLAASLSYSTIILPKQTEGAGSLLGYLNDIYSSVHSINGLLLKAFHEPLYQQYFNISLQSAASELSSHFKHTLPIFFQPYSEKVFLNQDFCTFKPTGLLISHVKCEDVFEGLMKNGLGEVQHLYSINGDIIANTSLALISGIKRFKAIYPTYIQLIYAQQMIEIGLKNYVNVFLTAAELYWQARMRNLYLFGGLLGVTLGLFVYMGTYCHKKTRERCRVAMKCFRLIPKSCILQMKNTKFMRENQLLETLEKL